MDGNMERCIFCKIAAKNDPKTQILYEDNEFVVFKDIKPAATHHYLVITKVHIKDPKQLNGGHIDLVEKMVAVGNRILEDKHADVQNSRFGFHWPPFTSVQHLHLHAISPTTEMGLIGKGIFSPNSFWFVTADWLLTRLKNMKSKTDALNLTQDKHTDNTVSNNQNEDPKFSSSVDPIDVQGSVVTPPQDQKAVA